MSETVFKRDEYTCQICDEVYEPEELNVYLLYPANQYPQFKDNPDNAITMCNECYKNVCHRELKNGDEFLDNLINEIKSLHDDQKPPKDLHSAVFKAQDTLRLYQLYGTLYVRNKQFRGSIILNKDKPYEGYTFEQVVKSFKPLTTVYINYIWYEKMQEVIKSRDISMEQFVEIAVITAVCNEENRIKQEKAQQQEQQSTTQST